MTTQDILELAARCEAATAEQQRDLIKEAGRLVWGRASAHYARLCDLVNVGAFLDAAMTLVPEGFRLTGLAETIVDCPLPWRAILWERKRNTKKRPHGDGATAALALTAASLKARAHTKGEE